MGMRSVPTAIDMAPERLFTHSKCPDATTQRRPQPPGRVIYVGRRAGNLEVISAFLLGFGMDLCVVVQAEGLSRGLWRETPRDLPRREVQPDRGWASQVRRFRPLRP